jgi:hypothetical protein
MQAFDDDRSLEDYDFTSDELYREVAAPDGTVLRLPHPGKLAYRARKVRELYCHMTEAAREKGKHACEGDTPIGSFDAVLFFLARAPLIPFIASYRAYKY